jgi:hypothetical protein
VVDRCVAFENIPPGELSKRTEAMRLLECGGVGKAWKGYGDNLQRVSVFTSPVADVEILIATTQRHNRLHSEARSLGIIGENEIVSEARSLGMWINQHKELLRDKKVIAECMQRRQAKLSEADAITIDTEEGLGAKVDKLFFPSTYGQDDPTKKKQERLSKKEAEALIQDNFMYVSTKSMLPNGAVLQACQLLFGQGGTSGNGMHRSLNMIKKRAIKKQEKYQSMTSGDEKTDGNDDGECSFF